MVLAVMATGLKDRAAEQATLTAEARRRAT
jgi:hypothetical protein